MNAELFSGQHTDELFALDELWDWDLQIAGEMDLVKKWAGKWD
jgi:hypothetical protein